MSEILKYGFSRKSKAKIVAIFSVTARVKSMNVFVGLFCILRGFFYVNGPLKAILKLYSVNKCATNLDMYVKTDHNIQSCNVYSVEYSHKVT